MIAIPIFLYYVYLFNRTVNMIKSALPIEKRDEFEIKEVEYNSTINLKDFLTCVRSLKFFYSNIFAVRCCSDFRYFSWSSSA